VARTLSVHRLMVLRCATKFNYHEPTNNVFVLRSPFGPKAVCVVKVKIPVFLKRKTGILSRGIMFVVQPRLSFRIRKVW
jgi:hypothetical protein